MSTSAAETHEEAARLRRPGWRDPRLLAGVMIVLLSVAGVVALVSSQDRTAPVYAADRQFAVGEQVSAEDLQVVEVRIDPVAGRYLSAEEELPPGLQFVTVVEEGELIPQRALAEADPQGRQAVTVEVDHAPAQAVEPGRSVDLWAVGQGSVVPEPQEGGSGARAEQLVASAEVSAVSESSSTFGASTLMTVELLIDPGDMAAVLEARDSAASLSVIPAGSAPEEEG